MTMTPSSALTPFEGLAVLSTAVSITNAGDGLSHAMSVDNHELHHKQVVHVVLECEVTKVRHDTVKDTDGVQRVHILKAGRATLVDGALVEKALDEMDRRIEAAIGRNRLFDANGDPVDPHETDYDDDDDHVALGAVPDDE